MAEYTGAELDELRKQAEDARAALLKRVDGKSNWDVADAFLLDALVELRLALDSPSVKLRFAAAEKLATVCSRMPPRPALPPEKGVTPEEWQQRAEAAANHAAVQRFMANHPAMQAAMAAAGWKPPAGVELVKKGSN